MPPSLHLPNPVQGLTAARIGDQVDLSWTTPATTTDGQKIKGAIIANVCFDTYSGVIPPSPAALPRPRHTKKSGAPDVAPSPACSAIQHLGVSPGPAKTSVALAPAQLSGAPKVIGYRIELLNSAGRSAGPSGPVYAAAGAAPPPVVPVKVSPRRESAAIEWRPDAAPAIVELRRTLVATAAGPASDAPRVKQAKSSGPFIPAAREPAREVVLRPDAMDKDAGGMIDTSVRDGDTYTYVAQRVQTVSLNGQKFELRSVPSAPVTFTYHDVFPPKAPAGLVLVPGGGFGETPSIDLSWDANYERDILGYNIYRSDGGGFAKINNEPVSVPAFHDTHVEPGHQYTYRVTAVDQRHNESAPGATASETLRK